MKLISILTVIINIPAITSNLLSPPKPSSNNISDENIALISGGYPNPRIVGGSEVSPKYAYPFMVSLQVYRQHFCGGSLIGENVVLTAGHCTDPSLDYEFEAVQHRHNLVFLDKEENGIRRNVTKRIQHPDYQKEGLKNDIGIWILKPFTAKKRKKVSNPYLKQKEEIDMLSLARESTFLGSRLGLAIGWGSTTTLEGASSPILMETRIPLFDMTRCIKIYTKFDEQLNATSQLCAGYPEGGRDVCSGDSGGPLLIKKKYGTGFYLVGIVSGTQDCAKPNIPSVYTRVANYYDWIINNSVN